MQPNTISPLSREDEQAHHPTKEQIDLQIERLIEEAMQLKQVRFNRYSVGFFDVSAARLPEGITFDRLGLYDTAVILNGNGCAQVRRRKRGPVTISFSIDPRILTEE